MPSFEVEYGVDSLRTVGLDVATGEFEAGHGWQLRSSGPITAEIDVADKCEVIREVSLDHATVDGALRIQDNRTGLTPIRLAGNTVRGA